MIVIQNKPFVKANERPLPVLFAGLAKTDLAAGWPRASLRKADVEMHAIIRLPGP